MVVESSPLVDDWWFPVDRTHCWLVDEHWFWLYTPWTTWPVNQVLAPLLTPPGAYSPATLGESTYACCSPSFQCLSKMPSKIKASLSIYGQTVTNPWYTCQNYQPRMVSPGQILWIYDPSYVNRPCLSTFSTAKPLKSLARDGRGAHTGDPRPHPPPPSRIVGSSNENHSLPRRDLGAAKPRFQLPLDMRDRKFPPCFGLAHSRRLKTKNTSKYGMIFCLLSYSYSCSYYISVFCCF